MRVEEKFKTLGASIFLAAALCLGVSAVFASEKDYPNRQIEVIINYPPGGPVDRITRIIHPPLKTALGVPILLTNKAGGTGGLGIEFVAKAKPDGYTVLSSAIAPFTVAPHLNPAITYKYTEFTPISLCAADLVVIASKPGAPWKNIEEWVDYAKKNPGKLSYGTPGMGSVPFFVFELLKLHYGLDIAPVHFQGSGPVRIAMLGGHVDLGALGLGDLMPQIRAGNVTPLLITASKRLPEIPNVPTIEEKGFPEASISIRIGLFISKKCTPAVTEKLCRDMAVVMKDPSVIQQIENAQMFAEYRDSHGSLKLIEQEFNTIGKVVQKLGLGK